MVLVSKDINIRLKARGCGIEAEDYQSDQLLNDIEQLNKGYMEFVGSFWDNVANVETSQESGRTYHKVSRELFGESVHPNQFIHDENGFLARVCEISEQHVIIRQTTGKIYDL